VSFDWSILISFSYFSFKADRKTVKKEKTQKSTDPDKEEHGMLRFENLFRMF
jgi:hypothetical protein